MRAGRGRELAIPHGAQFAAQRLLGDDAANLLENPLAKIDDPPAHDPMNRRDRAALDDRGERRPMRVVKPGWLSRRLAVDQALRPLGVELHHPVANDLRAPPADLGRLGRRRACVNRRQSQKPPRLRPVLRSPRRRPHHLRIKISPERNGHGEPPSFATLNQNPADSRIPNRVMPSQIRYKAAEYPYREQHQQRLLSTTRFRCPARRETGKVLLPTEASGWLFFSSLAKRRPPQFKRMSAFSRTSRRRTIPTCQLNSVTHHPHPDYK